MSEVHRFEVVGVGDVPAVLGVLVDRLGLRLDLDEDVSRRVLDTVDARLASADVVLEHRLGTDGTADLVVSRQGRPLHRVVGALREPPESLAATDLPARIVALAGDAPMVAAEPVRARIVTLSRIDDEDKTTVRVVLDRLDGTDGASPMLVEVLELRGYRSEAEGLIGELRAHMALAPAARSSVDRLRTAGVAGAGPSTTMTAAEGWRTVLQRLTADMTARFAGVLTGDDPEDLHAFRVAVRRIRTMLRDGDGVLSPEERTRFRTEFLWLGDITTPTRDADVLVADHPHFVAELPADRRAGLEPLLDVFVEHRRRAHAEMVAALRSPRRIALGSAWAAWLDDDRRWTTDVAPSAGAPVGRIAATVVRDAHRRLVKAGRAIGASSPASELHDLRKDAKRLRYLLEGFAPLFDADAVARVGEPLRKLQEALGTFQDDAVQARAVHDLAAERSADAGAGVETGVGAGVDAATALVVEHLERTSHRARARSREAFERFDRRRVRRAMEHLMVPDEDRGA